jgi:hypothetical protein
MQAVGQQSTVETLLITVAKQSVFYVVCSEATTANATVGVFFAVCSQAGQLWGQLVTE